ncbi:WecB/TagA/CpsF family glycosyltransferase [Candidatus Neomarinimicrobiota bacterium]
MQKLGDDINLNERYHILGVGISKVNLERTFQIMDEWIREKKREYIILAGAHGIVECQSDDKLRSIYNNAGLVTPDGMPEVWLGRIKGVKEIEKVYAPDIMMGIFARSASEGYRHFFYGGKEGVAELLTIRMEEEYPGIEIVGSYYPPFRPLTGDEGNDVIDQINRSGADIVWVGLGCPKQDFWMAHFRDRLEAPILIGVGAGFDFLSGEKPLAPKFIQNSGFEWFYRMLSEPMRLGRRYMRIVPKFIFLILMESLGLYKPSQGSH